MIIRAATPAPAQTDNALDEVRRDREALRVDLRAIRHDCSV